MIGKFRPKALRLNELKMKAPRLKELKAEG
jgi:hypothetical protein